MTTHTMKARTVVLRPCMTQELMYVRLCVRERVSLYGGDE